MTFASLYNANNVVVGAAMLFYAPWVPASLAVPPSLDTVASPTPFTTAYTTPWAAAGATDEGFKVSSSVDRQQITIEEQALPVASNVTTRGLSIQAALAEDTMANLKLAWGGDTIVTTAPTTVLAGKDVMPLTDVDTFMTVTLEYMNKLGLARRIYIPKVTVSSSGDTDFRRAVDKRMYAIQMDAICAPSAIVVTDFTAPHS